MVSSDDIYAILQDKLKKDSVAEALLTEIVSLIDSIDPELEHPVSSYKLALECALEVIKGVAEEKKNGTFSSDKKGVH